MIVEKILKNKLIFSYMLLVMMLPALVFADTNGIWHYASDVRAGTFGGDEGFGNFSFNGSVGIGNTNPTQTLDVNGGVKIKYPLNIDDKIFFESGNVGIAPDIHFDSQGLIAAQSNMYFNVDSNNDQVNAGFYFKNDASTSAGSTLMTIRDSGRVGIGITNPSELLDVNGKIRMRTQTESTDGDDIVVTKKYVDDQLASGSQEMYSASGSSSASLSLPAGNWAVVTFYNGWLPWSYTNAAVTFRFNGASVYSNTLYTARDNGADHASDSAIYYHRQVVAGPATVNADMTGDISRLTKRGIVIMAHKN